MVEGTKAKRLFKKSIEVLESVQLPNGGCLATPPGKRYPYVYPRDHAIILLGFLAVNKYNRVKKGLNFMFSAQLDSGAFPQRVDKLGNDASYKPIQIDNTALTLYTLAKYVEATHDYNFFLSLFDNVEKAASYIIGNIYGDKDLVFTPNSIHEFPPMEKGLEIWANAISSAALFELYKLSKEVGKEKLEWKEYAGRIKRGITTFMWNSRKKTFVKTIRIKESSSVVVDPDASKYAVADFGVLHDKDERVISTVRDIEKNLWHKQLGGICRYPKYEGRNNGGWGPWPHFTLMIARHFIRRKLKKKADQYMDWVVNVAYKYELPEHIATVEEFEEYVQDFSEAGLLRQDRLIMIENARKHEMFKKGIAYITLPLAWPHAEFIRSYVLYKEVWG